MCIYHYPHLGLYLYASTEEILRTALLALPFRLGQPERIDIFCGQILRIDAQGKRSHSYFDDQNLYHRVGFIDVGYRKRYYEDNKEDALIMYREFSYEPEMD